jgi:hypothetical protein
MNRAQTHNFSDNFRRLRLIKTYLFFRVFQALPQLKRLDGIPRLESDLQFDQEYVQDNGDYNGCVIL